MFVKITVPLKGLASEFWFVKCYRCGDSPIEGSDILIAQMFQHFLDKIMATNGIPAWLSYDVVGDYVF